MSPYEEVIARACKARGIPFPEDRKLLIAVMAELDADRYPEETAGFCPKCGSHNTSRGYADSYATGEVYYSECEVCGEQWGQS